MKTNIEPHESLSELQDFVAHQAVEDAVLSASERRYQAELVADVLKQEPLKPSAIKRLVNSYSASVARHLKTGRIVTQR